MVVDSHFPHCPISNVLARICGADTLWVVLLLGEKHKATTLQLAQNMKELTTDEVASAIELLAADHIIASQNNKWHLTKTGLSLLPRARNMVRWCEQNLI